MSRPCPQALESSLSSCDIEIERNGHEFILHRSNSTTSLTDVEAVDRVALGRQREVVAMLVDFEVAHTSPKALAYRQTLESARVAGTTDEQRLAERDPREQAL